MSIVTFSLVHFWDSGLLHLGCLHHIWITLVVTRATSGAWSFSFMWKLVLSALENNKMQLFHDIPNRGQIVWMYNCINHYIWHLYVVNVMFLLACRYTHQLHFLNTQFSFFFSISFLVSLYHMCFVGFILLFLFLFLTLLVLTNFSLLIKLNIYLQFWYCSGGFDSLLEQMVDVLCQHVSDDSPTARRLCLRGLVQVNCLN